MYCQDISELKLDERGIGYTYKALGAGFWALRQIDFRKALETIVFEVRILWVFIRDIAFVHFQGLVVL